MVLRASCARDAVRAVFSFLVWNVWVLLSFPIKVLEIISIGQIIRIVISIVHEDVAASVAGFFLGSTITIVLFVIRIASQSYESISEDGTWGCTLFVFILNWCIGNVACVIGFFYTGERFRMTFITSRFKQKFGSYYRNKLTTLSPGTYLFTVIGMILPILATIVVGLIIKEAVTHANNDTVMDHRLNKLHFSMCMSPFEYQNSVTLTLGLLSLVCGFLSAQFKYKRMLTV